MNLHINQIRRKLDEAKLVSKKTALSTEEQHGFFSILVKKNYINHDS